MKPTPQKQNGFTLIEIVIVLAIAALIMVIVFLAVQGAQRAQRDNTNKSAAGQALAQAEQFLANSSGTFPTPTVVVPATYLAGIRTSNGGAPTSSTSNTSAATAANQVIVVNRATCTNNAMTAGSGTQAAVSWWSEGAGSAQCINN